MLAGEAEALRAGSGKAAGDLDETQAFDILSAKSPDPTPYKPHSFDDGDTRRTKYQGIPPSIPRPLDSFEPPSTELAASLTETAASLDVKVLEAARSELGEKVLE